MLWVVDRSGAMPLSDQGHWETNGVTEVVFSYAVSYRTCPLSRYVALLGTTTLSQPDHFNPELPENSPTPHSQLMAYGALSSMIASASISTSISASMSPRTSTIDVAGRMAPKNSPCTRPTDSHWLMSVT